MGNRTGRAGFFLLSACLIGALAVSAARQHTQTGDGGAAVAGLAPRVRVEKGGGYFRRIAIDPVMASALQRGAASGAAEPRAGQVPEGALLVMETWHDARTPGAVFFHRKRGGVWLSGSAPYGTVNLPTGRRDASCDSCHEAAGNGERVFTLELLRAAVRSGRLRTIDCGNAGATEPCHGDLYMARGGKETR